MKCPVMRASKQYLTSDMVRLVRLAAEDDFDGWRDAARRLATAGFSADSVVWQVGNSAHDLFLSDSDELPPEPIIAPKVTRAFVDLAKQAVLHRDPRRFDLLYRLLTGLMEHPRLLEDAADPQVRRIDGFAKAVGRDMHKMRAFLRFRELDYRFVAWFEPDHHIVRANAGFFVRRFAHMQWSILTPELSLHWDGETLRESAGASRDEAAGEDALEDIWKAYYASTFNPARLKISAMLKEMPRRYWKNLPEAELITPLIAGAQARESQMVATPQAPESGTITLAGLRQEADHCRRCPLWKGATQCVFGEGPATAKLMIVGEQPGNEEDRVGHPFVGPAGKVLDRALNDAGVARESVYVTNAVKHFKYVARGKRRIHQTPTASEIQACRWWLDQEIGLLRPTVTLMLGATAIRGVTGKAGAVGALRSRLVPLDHGGAGVASYHPSYILRLPKKEASDRAYDALVDDLRRALDEAK